MKIKYWAIITVTVTVVSAWLEINHSNVWIHKWSFELKQMLLHLLADLLTWEPVNLVVNIPIQVWRKLNQYKTFLRIRIVYGNCVSLIDATYLHRIESSLLIVLFVLSVINSPLGSVYAFLRTISNFGNEDTALAGTKNNSTDNEIDLKVNIIFNDTNKVDFGDLLDGIETLFGEIDSDYKRGSSVHTTTFNQVDYGELLEGIETLFGEIESDNKRRSSDSNSESNDIQVTSPSSQSTVEPSIRLGKKKTVFRLSEIQRLANNAEAMNQTRIHFKNSNWMSLERTKQIINDLQKTNGN